MRGLLSWNFFLCRDIRLRVRREKTYLNAHICLNGILSTASLRLCFFLLPSEKKGKKSEMGIETRNSILLRAMKTGSAGVRKRGLWPTVGSIKVERGAMKNPLIGNVSWLMRSSQGRFEPVMYLKAP